MKTIAIALTLAAISSFGFAGVFTGSSNIGNCSSHVGSLPALSVTL